MAVETRFFYANGLELAVSLYDISFKFLRNGTLTPEQAPPAGWSAPGSNKGFVLDAILVSMSPTHAKAMLPGLAQAVAQYEAEFGPISLGKAEEALKIPESN